MGKLPPMRVADPYRTDRIFFSFPYHSVGDLILSLTLLERVHALWPKAQLDVAVGSSMAELVRAIPYVHRMFSIPRPSARQPVLLAYAAIHQATRLFQQQIASTPYDLAIAPRWDSADSYFSAHLAHLTGAPIRCGYSSAADGGSTQTAQSHPRIAPGGAHEHESLRYTRLLARCGLESLEAVDPHIPSKPIRALVDIAQARRAAHLALALPLPGAYAVLSPGATNSSRMWPVTRFAELGQYLHRHLQLAIVVIGSRADQALCQSLTDSVGPGAISLAGKTSPLQMLDLLAASSLFVGNDSGPAHIAGALGKQTFVISPFPASSNLDHPNSPQRFRPVGPRVHVLQPHTPSAPCSLFCTQNVPHCILLVPTSRVIETIASLNRT